jgi:hypothetical protein
MPYFLHCLTYYPTIGIKQFLRYQEKGRVGASCQI